MVMIFCHRGFWGCTDIGLDYLSASDAKGKTLSVIPPENSEESIIAAFEKGYNIEIDVVMTKDCEIIVTHTNKLSLHSKDAHITDFASEKRWSEIAKMRTGLGGRSGPFLKYERFLDLMKLYPLACANIEIKGTIQPKDSLPELENPSLIDNLIKTTPIELFPRIIWSSFALSNIVKMKTKMSISNVAQLFCEPKPCENPIYPNTDDCYLQFSIANIKNIMKILPSLDGVHPSIDTLTTELIEFCISNNLIIRTWALQERNPSYNSMAKEHIMAIKKFLIQYPKLKLDIITDYADDVLNILN